MGKEIEGYLKFFDKKFPIGKITDKTDIYRNRLFTGDIVIFANGEETVVCTTTGGIMGIINLDTQQDIDEYKIKKIRSYKTLKHNQTIYDYVTVILE